MSRYAVTVDGKTFEVAFDALASGDDVIMVSVDGEEIPVHVPEPLPDQIDWLIIDDRSYEVHVAKDLRFIESSKAMHSLQIRDLDESVARPSSGDGRVKAPIPGLVVQIFVEQGDRVSAGQPLLVLEAMKMGNEITAPRDGKIASIEVAIGESVVRNTVLVEID